MTDRPMIFSPAMVQALLDGRKTQTRRVFKPTAPFHRKEPEELSFLNEGHSGRNNDPRSWGWPFAEDGIGHVTLDWPEIQRFAVGDRIWVREAFGLNDYRYIHEIPKTQPCDLEEDAVCFRSTEDDVEILNEMPWRPSIHMPRWASRLTLIVTDVRVQRLQDISEADARAEGVYLTELEVRNNKELMSRELLPHIKAISDKKYPLTLQTKFMLLWNSLHSDEGKRWQDNPWIVAISFDVVRENIDRISP